MRLLLLTSLLIGIAAGHEVFTCNAFNACKSDDKFACDSLLKGFVHVEPNLSDYVNEQLTTSFDYLLLATHFNTYKKNRPGFQKVFQGLSDQAWDNAVNLIKHITKRGGSVPAVGILKKVEKVDNYIIPTIAIKDSVYELSELEAMAAALNYEKKLATDVQHLHHRAFHHSHSDISTNQENKENIIKEDEKHDVFKHYDPETAHYLEEEFLEPQTETIRKLSGYANDLAKLSKVTDPSLNYFLYDEYLAKQ